MLDKYDIKDIKRIMQNLDKYALQLTKFYERAEGADIEDIENVVYDLDGIHESLSSIIQRTIHYAEVEDD